MSIQLKAISIKQPWAHLIVHGIDGHYKDIENRQYPNSWRHYRGPLFIHASKAFDAAAAYNAVQWEYFGLSPETAKKLNDACRGEYFNVGGIIGVVDYVDLVNQSGSLWFCGEYGLVFRNPRPVKFLPCRGQLGIWNFSHEPFEEYGREGGAR